MIPREVYKEAMEESLKNAKALIRDAYLVGKQVSMTHALMLKNLAIEEIAKSNACWLVVAEILPRNHPMVMITGKKSVFRNHDVKNTLYMGLAGAMNVARMKRAGLIDEKESPEGLALGIGLASTIIGPMGTKKRFEWMYVDIVKNKEGEWIISSPLKLDNNNKVIDFRNVKKVIQFMDTQIRFLKDSKMKDHRIMMRKWYKDNDSDYPEKPEW